MDRLICPRCGPGFGLILIADRLENRRVIDGSLGCPNCRDRFPVEAGFGDLRPPPRSARPDAPDIEPPASPSAIEVAALLGLTDGTGNVALIGDMAGHATALAGLVPGVEFIGIAPGLRGWDEGEGVSRLNAGVQLPFSDGSLRGLLDEQSIAALADGSADPLSLASGAPPFAITSIVLEENGQITLSWNSKPDANFTIYYSTDLGDFGADAGDDFESQGETTAVTIPNPLPGSERLYLRVGENP